MDKRFYAMFEFIVSFRSETLVQTLISSIKFGCQWLLFSMKSESIVISVQEAKILGPFGTSSKKKEVSCTFDFLEWVMLLAI